MSEPVACRCRPIDPCRGVMAHIDQRVAEILGHRTKGTYIYLLSPGDDEAHRAWDTALAEFSNCTPPRAWARMTPLERADDAYYRWGSGNIDEEGNPVRCADGQECLAPHYPYDERLYVDPYEGPSGPCMLCDGDIEACPMLRPDPWPFNWRLCPHAR